MSSAAEPATAAETSTGPALELFGLAASPYARKNVVVLKYKTMPYKFTPLDPFDQRELLLTMNPLGKVSASLQS